MLTVIIPTYNRPKLLARALRSVKSQCYQQWQVIVADDGDGQGWETARRFGDDRITGFLNAGRGQTVARNTALERAQGEVVAFLDDDDWWEDPWYLTHVANGLSKQPGLLYCGGFLVVEDDLIERYRLPYNLSASAEGLRYDNSILISGVAYPRALHDSLGVFDESVGHYFDWDWYLRLVDAGISLQTIAGDGVCISIRPDDQVLANQSGEQHRAARQRDLDALCRKHGLTGIALKNHHSLLLEQHSHGPETLTV
jgi:glycosyltransferase involved in cell wall biosynthesis